MARCKHRDQLNLCTTKAWLQGCVVTQPEIKEDCNRYCEHDEHGFTSRVITRFSWKYNGSTASCEQRKNIQRFRMNKVSAVIKIFNRPT